MERRKIEESLIRSISKQEEMTRANITKAEQIGFKNTPDKIIITDQYGFIKKESK